MSAELDKARTRIVELVELIEEANHAYYQRSQPSISDAEYDILFRELEMLEQRYPQLLSQDSPTQRVGFGRRSQHSGVTESSNGFGEVKHREPMLSLANSRD